MSRTVVFVLVVVLVLLSFAAGYWLGLKDGQQQILDEIHQGVPDYEDKAQDTKDETEIS